MEPGSQAQPQRLPFNQQRRNQAQWQVVGQPNRGQVSGRQRQGQGPPNQSENQSQPPNPTPSQHEHQSQNQHVNQPHNQLPHQSQGPDRPNHNRSFRKRDTRERSHRFGAPVSQPGSSQSSDSEVVDRPGMRQHGLREAEREHLGTNAGRVPAHIEASKPEPAPKVELSVSDEQQLQEYTKQRDELNRNIEQLRAKLADRAEVAALRKQLEQLQAQFAEEQKLRKNLEGAYQESQKVQQKMQADTREVETQANQLRGQLRERDAHIQQLGDELNRKDQQLRDNQEQSDEANWRNNSALRDQENQIRVLTKEKEEALAEANARHVIIERHTNSIAGLERQLQEHVQKLEEKDEQLQAAQDSAWAKDEQLRDAEAAWKAQMDQMSLFHQRQGQHLQEAAHRAWHEKTVAQRQLEDFQQYHEKVVRQMQEQLASATRAPAGAAKPEPSHKGLPNGVPPPGAAAPSSGTRGPAEATPAPPILPPGVPPSILPSAHPLPAAPLAQGSRAVQPMHPASKPQSSQPVHPPNLQTDPPPPGQHQQGLQRRAVEPQPAPVSANPPANPPPPQNPVQFPPRQPEPYRPPTESAKPPAQGDPPVSAQTQMPQNARPGQEHRGKMLDEEGLLACFAELIPGKAEDAIAINTVLANKLTPRIAPHVWRTYRKEHGTLREFLAAHPQSFRVTPDDKVYLTPEAQQKRGTPPSSGNPAQSTASNSPTPQEASRAAAQNAPAGSVSESTAKGGSPPQVAVTPIATNAAAQKQRQRQQQNGPRSDSGGSNGRPAEPPAAANGKPAGGKANVSNRGNGHVAGNRPQGNGRVPAASNGENVSGGQNVGSVPAGNAKSGPRTDVQNVPRQGPLHVVNGNGPSVNGPSANGGSVNGGNAYVQQGSMSGGPARVVGSNRQIGSKSPSSAQPSKPLYVPKGATAPAKESEIAKP